MEFVLFVFLLVLLIKASPVKYGINPIKGGDKFVVTRQVPLFYLSLISLPMRIHDIHPGGGMTEIRVMVYSRESAIKLAKYLSKHKVSMKSRAGFKIYWKELDRIHKLLSISDGMYLSYGQIIEDSFNKIN